MFGRRAKGARPADNEVAVDSTLELDLSDVEESIEGYLKSPSEEALQSLTAVLEQLDARIDSSDNFHNRMAIYSNYGMPPNYGVFGETSKNPTVQEVQGSVLRAQVDLVKAAKNCVRAPSTDLLDALRTALSVLTTARSQPDGP